MKLNRLLQKLDLYKKNPDIVQPLTPAELADLVILVLDQVKVVDKAIKEGRLDGYTPQPDKDYLSKETALKLLTKSVNDAVKGLEATLTKKGTAIESSVQQALANVRDGRDGVVTEEEIKRAAAVAASLIELPDFDALIAERTTANPEAIRNALELLTGEDRYTVEITDVQGLQDRLDALARIKSSPGGGIGKNQVYSFIQQAITAGVVGVWSNGSNTTSKLTVASSEPSNPSVNDLWVDIS